MISWLPGLLRLELEQALLNFDFVLVVLRPFLVFSVIYGLAGYGVLTVIHHIPPFMQICRPSGPMRGVRPPNIGGDRYWHPVSESVYKTRLLR